MKFLHISKRPISVDNKILWSSGSSYTTGANKAKRTACQGMSPKAYRRAKRQRGGLKNSMDHQTISRIILRKTEGFKRLHGIA